MTALCSRFNRVNNSVHPSDPEADRRNKELEQMLAEENSINYIKLLLLGPGECGKSTILKQMRILHDKSADLNKFYSKSMIYSNIIDSMCSLVKAMPSLNIEFGQPEMQGHAAAVVGVLEQAQEQKPFTLSIVNSLKMLWSDAGVQTAYNRRNEFSLNDGAKYFLDDLDRIQAADYEPTQQDYLRTRVATVGIAEVRYDYDKATIRVFDVGGQKSQRRKWLHIFDDVDGIIFIVAMNEFDQMLREDSTINRMADALRLFDETINNTFFEKTSVIMFLNKKDLFAEKLKTTSISAFFEDFKDGLDYDKSVSHIQSNFQRLVKSKKSRLHFHQTCAIDTNQVQLVWTSVTSFIIKQNQRISAMT